MRDLGISDGRMAEIEQRLEKLPHSTWETRGTEVVRSSIRRAGELVAECCDVSVSAMFANAPDDIQLLVNEVAILREQKAMIGNDRDEFKARSLRDRVELQKWKDKSNNQRRAWRSFKEAIE